MARFVVISVCVTGQVNGTWSAMGEGHIDLQTEVSMVKQPPKSGDRVSVDCTGSRVSQLWQWIRPCSSSVV